MCPGLVMTYVRLAKVSDFERVRVRSYRILGKYVAIVKESDGSLYAIEAGCKHNNADLTTGSLSGEVITCARHGWTYNIKTGECLNHVAAPLRRHGLRVEGPDILVSMRPLASRDAAGAEKLD